MFSGPTSHGTLPAVAARMLPKSCSTAQPASPASALQLLLVESEPSRVKSVVRMLESARPEWRVNVVRDRQAANRALSEASFDAVLLDIDGVRIDAIDSGALLTALEDHVLAAAGGARGLRVAS